MICVLLIVKVGSSDEEKKYAGISHLLEHMMFRSIKNITEKFSEMGAEWNAYTNQDQTGYYVKVYKEYCGETLKLLADMMGSGKFTQSDLDKEKEIVLEEINAIYDNPRALGQELFEQNIFHNNSLSNSVAGDKTSIDQITLEVLQSFYKKYYCPDNSIMCLTGNISIDEGDKLIQKYFGEGSSWKANKCKKSSMKSKDKNGNVKQKYIKVKKLDEVSQEVINIGFPISSGGFHSENKYALELLNIILGGNTASRLYRHIRQDQGLVYTIKSYISLFYDKGYLCISTFMEPNKVLNGIENILKELLKIYDEGVTKYEVENAKKFLIGNNYIKYENLLNDAVFYGQQLLYLDYSDLMTVDEYIDAIKKVSVSEVNKVVRDAINKKILVTCVGETSKKDLEKLIEPFLSQV